MTTKTRVITIKPTAQMLENYMPSFVRGTGSSYFGTVVLNDELVLRAAFKEKTGDDLDMIGFNVDQLQFVYDNYRDLLPAENDLVNVNGEWVLLSDLLNETEKQTGVMKNSNVVNTLSFSAIKTVKAFCEDLHSEPNYKEVLENIAQSVDDFEVDNVRFIKDDEILSVMVDEIFSDNYILGCFNASFIASNSSLPIEMIEACQNNEAFEAIGEALNNTLSDDEKESFCADYASSDGYGHHFNHYDFNEEELTINGTLYHVFDNH